MADTAAGLREALLGPSAAQKKKQKSSFHAGKPKSVT
jgi:hypothetical protein